METTKLHACNVTLISATDNKLKCTIQLAIGDQDIVALIDIGAMSNFMTKACFGDAYNTIANITLQPSPVRVVAANNTELGIIGQTTVPASISMCTKCQFSL